MLPSERSLFCSRNLFRSFSPILDSDEELFECNPEEYIRRDIEGSDVDTRRRAACDLVKVLGRSFEQEIEKIFGAYVRV